ncbi:MAG: VIT1/CCC1 transporter family protein [Bryobacteraceae bacterium]
MAIYIARGIDPTLAKQVAEQPMAHDALGAHARHELGISAALSARPIQTALTPAGSFAVGAVLPPVATAIAPAADIRQNSHPFPETRWQEVAEIPSPACDAHASFDQMRSELRCVPARYALKPPPGSCSIDGGRRG